MSDERRYSEDEVGEILRLAADRSVGLPPGGAPSEAHAQGFTLDELQEIGQEVGIAREVVADAARALDRPQGIERTFGLPMTVGRTVHLPRDLTDLEWERLVGELRETFRARGKVRQYGRLREWSNGNLHALVEPTEDGWRLRMGTTKGQSRALMTGGGTMLGFVALMAVLYVLGIAVDAEELASLLGVLGPIGAAMVAAGALQLPGWARKRREQMEAIAGRVEASVGALPPGEGEGG